MEQKIMSELTVIEQHQGIKILFACESGSRGWQFPSPDSDFDVRFIYVRPCNFYISVLNRKYDLNFPINDELDIYGWDIRKVLQLVRKSNTTPFEWLQSPVVYKEETGFKNELWSLCQHYFSPRANIHHYLGITQGALETIANGNQIKIKKLFYVLRPLLAAKWCLERNSIAPMTIGPLTELLPPHLQKQVKDLIQLKAGAAESFVIEISHDLKLYIDHMCATIHAAAKDLSTDNFGVEQLDEFFIKTIRQYDY